MDRISALNSSIISFTDFLLFSGSETFASALTSSTLVFPVSFAIGEGIGDGSAVGVGVDLTSGSTDVSGGVTSLTTDAES